MNLANSLLVQTPKLVSFRHLPMQIYNLGNPIDSIAATRVMDQDGIWRPMDMDIKMAPTHGNIAHKLFDIGALVCDVVA